jgi:hypothetical protein
VGRGSARAQLDGDARRSRCDAGDEMRIRVIPTIDVTSDCAASSRNGRTSVRPQARAQMAEVDVAIT